MLRIKKFAMAAVVVAVLFTLVPLVASWTASDPGYSLEYARSDRGILPIYVEGNTPATVNGQIVFKQEYGMGDFQLAPGSDPVKFTFHVNPLDQDQILEVWLAFDVNGVVYVKNWASFGVVVQDFIMKGGPGFLVYTYNGAFNDDGHLYTPRVGVNDQNIAGISHIDLIFNPAPEETSESSSETSASVSETSASSSETSASSSETSASASQATASSSGTSASVSQTSASQTQTTPPLAETISETTEIPDEEIPQSGESGTSTIIGLSLLGLAGGLTMVLRRGRARE